VTTPTTGKVQTKIEAQAGRLALIGVSWGSSVLDNTNLVFFKNKLGG